MPAVQLGPNDRFWRDNIFTASADTPCGYDLDNLPNTTFLGGWDAATVSLAYRDRGEGRLWLVESDWQDGDPVFTDASRDLMRYMVSRLPVSHRRTLMLCGNSQRNVATFIPPGWNLDVVVGCVPDSSTQALFVTRSGTVDADTLDAYLEAGGNVISEYSRSDEVFNWAFGAAVAQGAGNGNCGDNVAPPVQQSPGDPFWQENGFIPPGSSGCGSDMSGFPRITPLGGWDANTVSLAYRDRGRGRAWLVEADWQDTDAQWIAASDDLMRSMVSWTRSPLRSTLMLCGTSNRDVTEFIPPGSNLALTSGCVPDGNTQAMLVSRDGAYQASDLQTYLAGGGRVVTEWSNSAAVFNAVFGEGVVQGAGQGNCRDLVAPPLQFSPDDPFWRRNREFTPPAEIGCGFDMAAYPAITRLGGWDANTVSLAYRDFGAGRLWLVEADWQDSEVVPQDRASTDLMNTMIAMPLWQRACSDVATEWCRAKGWNVVGPPQGGNLICTAPGVGVGSDCNDCNTYNVVTWANELNDRFCGGPWGAVGGNVYGGHSPCACGDNLLYCGAFPLRGCIPD